MPIASFKTNCVSQRGKAGKRRSARKSNAVPCGVRLFARIQELVEEGDALVFVLIDEVGTVTSKDGFFWDAATSEKKTVGARRHIRTTPTHFFSTPLVSRLNHSHHRWSP